MIVNKKRLREYFSFMAERHSIFVKRFVELKPAPWTDDEALRTQKYTNIYRELDRGTVYWWLRVLNPFLKGETNFGTFLYDTLGYRLLNRVETFRAVGLPSKAKSAGVYRGWLEDYSKKLKQPIWTSAHLIAFGPGIKRLDGYQAALEYYNTHPAILRQIEKRHKSPEKVFNTLRQIRGCGHFIAYEIVCDLAYAGIVKNIDTWCNVGPGAKPACDLIFPNRQEDGMSYLDCCLWLYKNHQRFLKEFKLKIRFPKFANGRFSLRVCEHSLCEWRKYAHAAMGKGRARTKFEGLSNTEATPYSPVDTSNWYYQGLKKLGFLK